MNYPFKQPHTSLEFFREISKKQTKARRLNQKHSYSLLIVGECTNIL